MRRGRYDKPFLIITLLLVAVGFLIFASASLGPMARNGTPFLKALAHQAFFGLLLGGGLLLLTSSIDYRIWKRFAIPVFFFAFLLTLLVFVPSLGFEHGGAKRWLSFGPIFFQPSEILKFGFIIYLSAWLAAHKTKISTFRLGLVPFIAILGFVGTVLIFQPDIGTLLVIGLASVVLFFIAGAKYKAILVIFLIAILGFSLLVLTKPYLVDRLLVFVNPSSDLQGAGYQLNQSLIAIGSGGLFGRGFGMGIQKFKYLPEPVSDSIFSIAAEEFGFIGSVVLIGMFLLFFWRGFLISMRAPDAFGQLLGVGIVMLIVGQSLINIASMIGLMPLTGLPLIFISKGASAFMMAMAEVGILLNISKYARK